MTARIKTLVFSLLLVLGLVAQDQSPFQLWQLTNFSGQFRARGTYRDLATGTTDALTHQGDGFLDGFFQFRSRSFFLHPNFCELSLNGVINPQTSNNYYVGVPYTEKTTTQGLDGSAIFFKKKGINLVMTGNVNNSFSNIENLTQVRSNTKSYGAVLNSTATYFPFNIGYTRSLSDQITLGTTPDQARDIYTDIGVLQATSSKSFTSHDNTSLSFVQTQTISSQSGPELPSALQLNYLIYNSSLNNSLFFDQEKKYILTSSVSNTDESGSLIYRQLFGQENLSFKLPYKMTWTNYYNWSIVQQDTMKMYTQGFQSYFNKQFFESLNAQIGYDHRSVVEQGYNETRNRYSVDFRYSKKIPKGKLAITYGLSKDFQQVSTPTSEISIVREQYTLSDNDITLLKRQDIEMSSIVVRDQTGALIYQPNLDYFLIQKGSYIEIVRIPGGLIPNLSNVYIDYKALQPGLYHYEGTGNNASVDLILWNGLLNPYYRYNRQDYSNATPTANLVLNYLTRQLAGVRMNYKDYKAGVEYEDYQSSIIPYRSMKYFIGYQKLFRKMFFSGYFNLQEIQMAQEAIHRQDADAAVKVGYKVRSNMKLDFEYQLKNIRAQSMDLNSQVLKLDLTTYFQMLYVSLGANIYSSYSDSYVTDYKGVYILLTRNF